MQYILFKLFKDSSDTGNSTELTPTRNRRSSVAAEVSSVAAEVSPVNSKFLCLKVKIISQF